MPDNFRGRFGLSNVARVGVFSALAFGVNAPFLVIPNVEVFSLALFLSGIFLGIIDGLAVALISGVIFVLFNPNGPQTLPLVGLAQLFGFILFGLTGGLLRPIVLHHSQTLKIAFLLAFCGGALTLWYDLSTNLVFAIILGPFWPTVVSGMAFGIIHIVGNIITFALSSLIIQRIWKRVGYLLPPLAG
jgi:hypothetical protein